MVLMLAEGIDISFLHYVQTSPEHPRSLLLNGRQSYSQG